MRRALVLLSILMVGSGCLAELRCPGCGNAWHAAGHDEAIFGALATMEGVRESNVTRFREALPFARPELDAAWREYALVGVAWHPEGEEHRVSGGLDPLFGHNVSISGAFDAPPREVVERWMDELLAPLVPASDLPRVRDAMFANASATGRSTTTDPVNGTVTRETGWRYAATLAQAPDVQAHFDALAAQGPWSMVEAETANVADAKLDRWTFVFWFPVRSFSLDLGAERLGMQANSHANFTAHYQNQARLMREEEVVARVNEILAQRGAGALDVAGWDWEGERVNYGPGPTIASPEPTPVVDR